MKNLKKFHGSLGFGWELNQVYTLNRYSINVVSSLPTYDRNISKNTGKNNLDQKQIIFKVPIKLFLNSCFPNSMSNYHDT